MVKYADGDIEATCPTLMFLTSRSGHKKRVPTVSKRIKQPVKETPLDIKPGDICLLGDDLVKAQMSLAQLSKNLTAVALQKYERDENPIIADLDLDTDLLERIKEIATRFGKTIEDWAKVTIAQLSIIVEEIRAVIGSKQLYLSRSN